MINKLKAKIIVWFLKGVINEKETKRKEIFYWKLKQELENKEVKPMIDNVKNKLAGKKTYLIALVGIIGAMISWVNGQVDTTKALELIIEAILACTIRAGVSKSQGGN